MTLVYQRQLPPAQDESHALVVGVGSYPHLAVAGAPAPDLPSATAGAELLANWLLICADSLRPQLASVELLLSPAGGAQGTYSWPPLPPGAAAPGFDPRAGIAQVEAATGPNLEAAGTRWRDRLIARPGNNGVLYVCGHGVATPSRNVVFLSDTAKNPLYPWAPHLDVQQNIVRMRRHAGLGQAYVFVDACQELVTDALLAEADRGQGLGTSVALFPPVQIAVERNKVYSLVPGPMGALAFDDGVGGGGRFTQILVEALSGAAAWNYSGTGQWGVTADNLHTKMKLLHSLRDWNDHEFDPTPASLLVGANPLLEFAQPPKVPTCIRFEPSQAMQDVLGVRLINGVAQPIVEYDPLPPVPRNDLWIAWPQAAAGGHFIEADFPPNIQWQNVGRRTQVDISEMRVRPIVVHDIR